MTYTVHDRIYCHRLIAEFRPHDGFAQGGHGWHRTRKRHAEELAARLNAKHEAWLALHRGGVGDSAVTGTARPAGLGDPVPRRDLPIP